MLRLYQLKLPVDQAARLDADLCRKLVADRLGLPLPDIQSALVSKRSVDARGHGEVHFTLTLDVTLPTPSAEMAVAKRFPPNLAAYVPQEDAQKRDVFTLPVTPFPAGQRRPVVIGAGPAGLFCALGLAARGAKPILLERGKPVQERAADVAALERDGILNPDSNVLFGEGGAGAFSDGKLTCGLNDPTIRVVLQTLVACGAPEEITIAAKPHIGTDLLRGVITEMRKRLIAMGGDVYFQHKVVGLTLRKGHISGVQVAVGDAATPLSLDADAVYLAIGHSARDTYTWLHAMGVPMQAKPFAMGVRIEHPQSLIDRAQYGTLAGRAGLPPADYKINVPTPDGRGCYTFCMCPGGQVINASSEPGLLNVNGMSLHARTGENANAALLVGVTPADYGSDDALAGIQLQRRIERTAFDMGGDYEAPGQRVADFVVGKPTKSFTGVRPSYRPGVFPADLITCLPPMLANNLRFALPRLDQRLRGFAHPEAVITAPETRTSSPVRLLRDATRQSEIKGLYPLGEGAGYAGGIISAAVDGLRAALDATT